MFRCQNKSCQLLTEPRQPVNRIVTERRERQYEKLFTKGRKAGQLDKMVDGWEIVKEIQVCPRCYRILTGMKPKTVQVVAKFENKPRGNYDDKKKGPRNWKNDRRKNQAQAKDGTNKPKPKEQFQRKKPKVEVINPIPLIKG